MYNLGELSKSDELNMEKQNQLRSEYKRYIRNKIIMDGLNLSKLDEEMNSKVKTIVTLVKLKQCSLVSDNEILDLNLNDFMLGYQERDKLKQSLEFQLSENHIKLYSKFKEITSKDLEQFVHSFKSIDDLFNMSPTKISEREKLAAELEKLKNNIDIRTKLFENMLEYRLRQVPNLCAESNDMCRALIECNLLKSKIVEYKTRIEIFMEIPCAFQAYQELLNDIKEQCVGIESAIETMSECKRKYENCAGEEYDQILQSYLMYIKSIEKLNKMSSFFR